MHIFINCNTISKIQVMWLVQNSFVNIEWRAQYLAYAFSIGS
jgi:hypothetical protein